MQVVITTMDTNLLDIAMKMSPKERVAFAELIFASIDYEEAEIRKAWITEAKNRMKAVKEGKSKLLDFERVYNDN